MKREIAEKWWAEHFAELPLIGYVPVSSTAGPGANSSVSSRTPFESANHGPLRGLDNAVRLVLYDQIVVLYLTQTELHVVSTGGMWKRRPRELRHSIDRSGLRVQWFDYSELKTGWRNFLIQIPDGTWMGVASATMILGRDTAAKHGADTLIDWLGADAVEIDWRNPPAL